MRSSQRIEFLTATAFAALADGFELLCQGNDAFLARLNFHEQSGPLALPAGLLHRQPCLPTVQPLPLLHQGSMLLLRRAETSLETIFLSGEMLFAFDESQRRRVQSGGNVGPLLVPGAVNFEQPLPLFQEPPTLIGHVARQSLKRRRHFDHRSGSRQTSGQQRALAGSLATSATKAAGAGSCARK